MARKSIYLPSVGKKHRLHTICLLYDVTNLLDSKYMYNFNDFPFPQLMCFDLCTYTLFLVGSLSWPENQWTMLLYKKCQARPCFLMGWAPDKHFGLNLMLNKNAALILKLSSFMVRKSIKMCFWKPFLNSVHQWGADLLPNPDRPSSSSICRQYTD